MNKLEGEWRLHKLTNASGDEFYAESDQLCGFTSPLFGLYCKWRWTLDNKGNATYLICQEPHSDSLCTAGYGKYELKAGNKKVVFTNSFFSFMHQMGGMTDSVLTLTELKKDIFRVQTLYVDSLDNEYRDTYEFRKMD